MTSTVKTVHELDHVTRRAHRGDNVIIVLQDLEPGEWIRVPESQAWHLRWTVLEGHRIASEHIPTGTPLLSWGLPFGKALRDIEPGEALFNEATLRDLRLRGTGWVIPEYPNFSDWHAEFTIGSGTVRVTEQVPLHDSPGTFQGFDRGSRRGSGTRNHVVILGVSSRVAGFIRLMEKSIPDGWKKQHGDFDGVRAVHHTEGGSQHRENNHELVLRTLAGWVTHPNAGAVLLVDEGGEPVNNASLLAFMKAHGYPLEDVSHRCMSIGGRPVHECVGRAREILDTMVRSAGESKRTARPLSHLRVALQCGGSDAFSGMSGNPLAGLMAREILRHGGAANLAETSELIGAESYVLARVRNIEVARQFMDMVHRFQEMAGWHGHSAEGNPSGGNIFRGLYNIIIKSIGAANKKSPDVRLDHVIEYSEPMKESGFHFMDSAGNDLESIAGQTASGCNMILFITGNGSITNFPFVPTLKIVTTTQRFNFLRKDMDINAGEYLDGMPMEELAAQSFDHMVRVAGGQLSTGERAGHSQAQIWRTWHLSGPEDLAAVLSMDQPDGKPVPVHDRMDPSGDLPAVRLPEPSRKYHILVPTSLCSSQVASMFADELSERYPDLHFRALAHTEGCGVSRGPSEELFVRTMSSYATHPLAQRVVFLEHGCEKTHQAEFRDYLKRTGDDPARFSWMSIQGDGGLDAVRSKIYQWPSVSESISGGREGKVSSPILAVMPGFSGDSNAVPDEVGRMLLQHIADLIHKMDGSVVMAENDPVLSWVAERLSIRVRVTLPYGGSIRHHGFHVMEMPTRDRTEILTGLEASGAVWCLTNGGVPHPGISQCLSLTSGAPSPVLYAMDADGLSGQEELLAFQITRGNQGFSL